MYAEIRNKGELGKCMGEALGTYKGWIGCCYNDKRNTFRRFKFSLVHVSAKETEDRYETLEVLKAYFSKYENVRVELYSKPRYNWAEERMDLAYGNYYLLYCYNVQENGGL
jgi:hypothetical protein